MKQQIIYCPECFRSMDVEISIGNFLGHPNTLFYTCNCDVCKIHIVGSDGYWIVNYNLGKSIKYNCLLFDGTYNSSVFIDSENIKDLKRLKEPASLEDAKLIASRVDMLKAFL